MVYPQSNVNIFISTKHTRMLILDEKDSVVICITAFFFIYRLMQRASSCSESFTESVGMVSDRNYRVTTMNQKNVLYIMIFISCLSSVPKKVPSTSMLLDHFHTFYTQQKEFYIKKPFSNFEGSQRKVCWTRVSLFSGVSKRRKVLTYQLFPFPDFFQRKPKYCSARNRVRFIFVYICSQLSRKF